MWRYWPENKEWTVMSKLKGKGSEVRKAVSEKTCRGQGTENLDGIT